MDTTTLIIGAAIMLFAGIVRGFSGFGFSAITIGLLSFFYQTKEVRPVILMLEVLASVWMLRDVWKDVDWRWVMWTFLGLMIGAPIGVWALAYLPDATVQVILYSAIFILAVTLLLQQAGIVPKFTAPDWVVGIPAGIANGLAGLAGMVLSLFLLSSGRTAAIMRASMVIIFFLSDIYSIIFDAGFGLIGQMQLQMMAYFIVPMLIGISAGIWIFRRTGERNYRTFAIGLVLVIAVTGMLRLVL